MLYQLSYVSNESCPLNTADLSAILGASRAQNEKLGISGLLLYKRGSFMQVLEGTREAVTETYERIRRDPRHGDLEVLFEGPIESREFNDWSMAFVDLNGVDPKALPGFSDFMMNEDEPRRFLEELSHAKRFLLLFRALQ